MMRDFEADRRVCSAMAAVSAALGPLDSAISLDEASPELAEAYRDMLAAARRLESALDWYNLRRRLGPEAEGLTDDEVFERWAAVVNAERPMPERHTTAESLEGIRLAKHAVVAVLQPLRDAIDLDGNQPDILASFGKLRTTAVNFENMLASVGVDSGQGEA